MEEYFEDDESMYDEDSDVEVPEEEQDEENRAPTNLVAQLNISEAPYDSQWNPERIAAGWMLPTGIGDSSRKSDQAVV